MALPRGALLEETLDVLDRIGADTAGLRSDSRSLIFETEDLTFVTMRPSDVPTYVEAGAADVGITGKDVLMEQSDRVFYELSDLGYGGCRMVLAGPDGDDRLDEQARRLGALRIATKYPRIAQQFFEDTGRAAEVIEVKGSVELAPISGLADAIVDLVDTGRTLAGQRPGGPRGDRGVHRAPDREPRRPQASRPRDRRSRRAPQGGDVVRVERIDMGRPERPRRSWTRLRQGAEAAARALRASRGDHRARPRRAATPRSWR